MATRNSVVLTIATVAVRGAAVREDMASDFDPARANSGDARAASATSHEG
jgi:hypothetical protein